MYPPLLHLTFNITQVLKYLSHVNDSEIIMRLSLNSQISSLEPLRPRVLNKSGGPLVCAFLIFFSGVLFVFGFVVKKDLMSFVLTCAVLARWIFVGGSPPSSSSVSLMWKGVKKIRKK